MRNNPKHGNKLEYTELFESLAKVEKIRRFFSGKRQRIFKHFTLQPYHSNFCKKDVKEYLTALDVLLMMDRKLVAAFDIEEHFPEPADEQIGFDHFYDTLSKWACEQTDLSYEDLAAIDEDRKEQQKNFKKNTDKVL